MKRFVNNVAEKENFRMAEAGFIRGVARKPDSDDLLPARVEIKGELSDKVFILPLVIQNTSPQLRPRFGVRRKSINLERAVEQKDPFLGNVDNERPFGKVVTGPDGCVHLLEKANDSLAYTKRRILIVR
jgi:hypothetical protein